jgi:hypothetical protein
LLDAQGVGQECQDARDGAKTAGGLQKEWQGYPNHLHRGQAAHGLRLARDLTQTRLGRFEGLLGLGSLGLDSCELCAQGTLLVATLFGCVFPLISTVFAFGEWPHHRARSSVSPLRRPRVGASFEVPWSPEESARGGVRHLSSARAARRPPPPHHERRRYHDVQPEGSQAHGRRALSLLWRGLRAVSQHAVLSAVALV